MGVRAAQATYHRQFELARAVFAPVVQGVTDLQRARQGVVEVLRDVINLRNEGRTPFVVFDIDNTLVDTRYRTLAAAHAFSFVRDGTVIRPFRHATIDDICYRPADTARKLGCKDAALIHAFADFFNREFWRPERFVNDRRLAMPIELAKRAHELGAEIIYLTGRTENYRAVTEKQLKDAGLPVASARHLLLKSQTTDRHGRFERTERFKAQELRRIDRKLGPIAAFVSEGARDIAHLQSCADWVRRFLFIDFPIDEPGHHIRQRRTFVLPLSLELPTRREVSNRA